MNKKLLAVAVAGALAAPGLAMAQSSVTISGAIHMSVDNLRYGDSTRVKSNESRLNDESSSIIFTVREDLGGGMQAIALVDVKPNLDTSAIAASGQSYIGLSSKNMGIVSAGRHNFHFFKTPWDGYGLGAALKVHPTSLIDFAGGGGVAIANATRTNNSLRYSSPNWGGFTMDVGYSFNPTSSGAEADMTAGNTLRNGRAWTLNPTFTGSNYAVGYSYWSGKLDAANATIAQADQRSDSLYGYYSMAGFKLGLMWNKSRLNTATTGAKASERTAWSIPIRYTFGQHSLLAHYTRANDDKATPGSDGAKMWTFAYALSLSKRTHIALAYSKITNDAAATYNFFTSSSGGGLSSVNAGPAAGEDPRIISLGMRHSF